MHPIRPSEKLLILCSVPGLDGFEDWPYWSQEGSLLICQQLGKQPAWREPLRTECCSSSQMVWMGCRRMNDYLRPWAGCHTSTFADTFGLGLETVARVLWQALYTPSPRLQMWSTSNFFIGILKLFKNLYLFSVCVCMGGECTATLGTWRVSCRSLFSSTIWGLEIELYWCL